MLASAVTGEAGCVGKRARGSRGGFHFLPPDLKNVSECFPAKWSSRKPDNSTQLCRRIFGALPRTRKSWHLPVGLDFVHQLQVHNESGGARRVDHGLQHIRRIGAGRCNRGFFDALFASDVLEPDQRFDSCVGSLIGIEAKAIGPIVRGCFE